MESKTKKTLANISTFRTEITRVCTITTTCTTKSTSKEVVKLYSNNSDVQQIVVFVVGINHTQVL